MILGAPRVKDESKLRALRSPYPVKVFDPRVTLHRKKQKGLRAKKLKCKNRAFLDNRYFKLCLLADQ